jgi:predicted acylesterase/phospholipase RssA
LLVIALSACTSFSHTNIKQTKRTLITTKATFDVKPTRGRNDTLVILAFSGGGSRAAYWAASVMFKLQQVFAAENIDILAEVDAISSVSGGSLPAAYYAISTDPGAKPLYGRVWDQKTVKELMTRNYINRWFGNWFWPVNMGRFWFTAYDRTDIMAQTFADNLYDTLPFGRDLKIQDLNPDRPYLILNATNGTRGKFGDPFTFTIEDFADIQSDINDYSLARAVMGTATFPAVFNYMTLKNYDKSNKKDEKFTHVFDGGNVDNLGLSGAMRIIEILARNGTHYDKLVVILVDSYAGNSGVSEDKADARKFFDFIVDTNFIDATDSLLTANREQRIENFRDFLNHYFEKDPSLKTHSIFYHIQFADIADDKLRQNLNNIQTNFKISQKDVDYIDQAADRLLTPANECLLAIKSLLSRGSHNAGPICAYHH